MKAAWLALLAGCSAGAIALDGFVAAYADAVCSAQARCLPRAAYLDEECRAAATAFFASDLQKAVATQRVIYNASKARECVEVLAAARCIPEGTVPVDFSPCLAALRGTLALQKQILIACKKSTRTNVTLDFVSASITSWTLITFQIGSQ